MSLDVPSDAPAFGLLSAMMPASRPVSSFFVGEILMWFSSMPAARRAAFASLTASPTTFGTLTESGPVETVSVTSERRDASVPPAGSWSMTVFSAALSATSRFVTVKSGDSVFAACSYVMPRTLATVTFSGELGECMNK